MLRLVCTLIIMLSAMPTALAQDWQDVDDNGIAYNCELIETLVDKYGDENIERDHGLFTTLADWIDDLFFDCL